MGTEIDIIQKIFNDNYKNASLDVIREEKENMERSLMKGRIEDEDIAIYRLDQNGNSSDMFPYLKGDSNIHGLKGMKRICDFVIFVLHGGELFVLLIEMKKGKDSPFEQLQVTEPFIDFIFNRAKLLKYWNSNYKVRKIGITDCAEKRTTSDRGEIVYDENNYVKLYANKRIYLERLLH